MQQFIINIMNFIYNIHTSIYNSANQISGQLSTEYLQFLNKNAFNEYSLIGINITWREIIFYLGCWVLVILFIVLFVKFIIKILGIFRTRFND